MTRLFDPRALAIGMALLLSACAGSHVREQAPAAVVSGQSTVATQVTGDEAADASTQAVVDVAAVAASTSDSSSAEEITAKAVDETASTPPAQQSEQAPTLTAAEDDFNALYGNPEYDPVADSTLPPGVVMPSSYDPWEPFNRRVHDLNNFIDRYFAAPLARLYVKAIPRPMRLGVSNFFNNLGQPVGAVNALLQGRPKDAGFSLLRFSVNSTLGVGGLFDVASRMKVPYRDEDFGQTLAVWGWRTSRYVELPIFGPRTVRDIFGMLGDAPLSPLPHIGQEKAQTALRTLQLADIRSRLFSVDRMREGAADDYALYRDAWLQRRNYQIMSGIRDKQEQDSSLPDYLDEEIENPDVPIDAIPIQP
ncbi:phospholipid-binding lipoprotein MlaA [Solilutibacter tolerans]|uniref:Phospholipid-binding lipoprotein MlaA n=1 Tax=Solilutibacter tolerans TaxID=1604334 RepID=A0A1N6RBH2_9GAMM|nr:phospholipid-binding lipoprotein MlaA [Lysobacter tolerans]